eukprot:CAMPEP_0194208790 /NCGR_PEP_ID=MMETSP0156-20130528/7134_1 /TAXON_ID=33649 /ORGANISM="Thalassionema nitzschioides, Strain L26-B" /LENGTH=386 /DNA_ID=CAMNT_0038935823 /DNA_START=70 /DNA_END=1227 /DNA_ORIENTATION=-
MRSIWKNQRTKVQRIEWFAFYCKSAGREYYFNPKTNVVTWVLPDDEHSDGQTHTKLNEIPIKYPDGICQSKQSSKGNYTVSDSDVLIKDLTLFGFRKGHSKQGASTIKTRCIVCLALLSTFLAIIFAQGWIMTGQDGNANVNHKQRKCKDSFRIQTPISSMKPDLLPPLHAGKDSKILNAISLTEKDTRRIDIVEELHGNSDSTVTGRIVPKPDTSLFDTCSDQDNIHCSFSSEHSWFKNDGNALLHPDECKEMSWDYDAFHFSQLVGDEKQLCIDPSYLNEKAASLDMAEMKEAHDNNSEKSNKGKTTLQKNTCYTKECLCKPPQKMQEKFSTFKRTGIYKLPLLGRLFSEIAHLKTKQHTCGSERFVVDPSNEGIEIQREVHTW